MPKIAVYAGHGGRDPGAIGVNGRREADMNLAVSNAATSILRSWGYQVINNRTTDTDRSITQDANRANDDRVDALVEIHQNSNEGTPGAGSEVFYSVKDTGRGRQLASAILRRLVALGFADRGVKTALNASGQDAFGILRLTNMPAVLVESAFINNPADMARFDVNRVAMAIAEGIREVFPLNGSSGGSGGGSVSMPPYPGVVLRVGARGESVRQVQRCLNRVSARQPSIQRLTEDGAFGPRTLDAVTTFQRIFGLAADGTVGPLTWAALARECSGDSGSGGSFPPYPGVVLRAGASGESVRQVQRCLNSVSLRHPSIQKLVEDGAFGSRTLDAVTTFQRIFGLSPDGAVGPATWAALTRECGGTGDTMRFIVLSNVE